MKTLSFLYLFTILVSISFAQEGNYETSMTNALEHLSHATTPEEMQDVSDRFERLSQSFPDSLWPVYYSALTLVDANWQLDDPQARDAILDKALQRIDEAGKRSPDNAEVETLHGYALMAKLTVDPDSRGRDYSPKIMAHYGQALELDPDNPRAYAMMARMEMGSAQYFGASLDGACGKAKRAIALFDHQEPRGFAPQWGRDQARVVLNACARQNDRSKRDE